MSENRCGPTSEEEKYLVQLLCLVDIFGGLWIGGPVMSETVRVLTTELSAIINCKPVAETESGGANVEHYSRCLGMSALCKAK